MAIIDDRRQQSRYLRDFLIFIFITIANTARIFDYRNAEIIAAISRATL